jgi:hypothetical protein
VRGRNLAAGKARGAWIWCAVVRARSGRAWQRRPRRPPAGRAAAPSGTPRRRTSAVAPPLPPPAVAAGGGATAAGAASRPARRGPARPCGPRRIRRALAHPSLPRNGTAEAREMGEQIVCCVRMRGGSDGGERRRREEERPWRSRFHRKNEQ